MKKDQFFRLNRLRSFPTPAPVSHRSYDSPLDLADQLQKDEHGSLTQFQSILRHPRSLARPVSTWRPPTLSLNHPGTESLNVTLSRYRVGPKTRLLIKDIGEPRIPAYLVSLRFSQPDGRRFFRATTEAWVRAFIYPTPADTVHRLDEYHTPIYCWLVDKDFRPIHSPASLFENLPAAA